MVGSRAGAVMALGACMLCLIYGFITVLRSAGGLNTQACPSQDSPNWWLILTCLAGLIVGHLVGSWRTPGRASRHPRANHLILHLALLLFLLFAVAALAYEGIGTLAEAARGATSNPSGLQPITAYIRCAKITAPVQTGVIAGALSFVVGHWLWYPARKEK